MLSSYTKIFIIQLNDNKRNMGSGCSTVEVTTPKEQIVEKQKSVSHKFNIDVPNKDEEESLKKLQDRGVSLVDMLYSKDRYPRIKEGLTNKYLDVDDGILISAIFNRWSRQLRFLIDRYNVDPRDYIQKYYDKHNRIPLVYKIEATFS